MSLGLDWKPFQLQFYFPLGYFLKLECVANGAIYYHIGHQDNAAAKERGSDGMLAQTFYYQSVLGIYVVEIKFIIPSWTQVVTNYF